MKRQKAKACPERSRRVKSQNYKTKGKSFEFLLVILPFYFLLLTFPCYASNEAALVNKGNEFYKNGKIDEAIKNYNQALTKSPDNPLVNFNIGNSLYKKSQYKEAIEAYEKALLYSDKNTEAGANYNIANCKFRQGKAKESSELEVAIADYRLALDYYKMAMELAPDDKDIKFNHEFVEKYLKALLDRLDKQRQNQQKQESGQGSKDQQQKESGDSASQEQKSQEQKSQEQKSQDQKDQQQENQRQAQQQEESQSQKQSQAQQDQKQGAVGEIGGESSNSAKEQDKEMSKEEATALLDDYRQQEQQDRQVSDRHRPARYQSVEKDW